MAGLLIGIMLGLLVGPAFRSWLLWHEVAAARRASILTDEILARMGEGNGDGEDGRFPDAASDGPH